MKQSTGYGTYNFFETFFNDAEKEVAKIMLQLRKPVFLSESLHRSPFTWSAKRKRSAIVSSPHLHSTPSQPSILRACVDEDERPISKTEKATSPVTPLSFSPTESDCKSKRKISKKRTAEEERLEIKTKLTQQRESLKREIEIVKRHHNELKAKNLVLKAGEQELSLCNKEKPNPEINKNLNLAMESSQQDTVKSPQDQQQILSTVHHPPLINDQTAYKPYEHIQYPCGQMTPCSTVLVGSSSFQLFDMNSALIRAMAAAEARRKRMKIYKEKNSIATKLGNGYR